MPLPQPRKLVGWCDIVCKYSYLDGDMTILPTHDCLYSSNAKFAWCNICSDSQVASSLGTPSIAPSALLWFCSLIFFSFNLSSGTHVLKFFSPKSKYMWILHIGISCNITTNTKNINQIHKNQICTIIFTSIFWKLFSELSTPFLHLYNSLKLVLSYQNSSLLRS